MKTINIPYQIVEEIIDISSLYKKRGLNVPTQILDSIVSSIKNCPVDN